MRVTIGTRQPPGPPDPGECTHSGYFFADQPDVTFQLPFCGVKRFLWTRPPAGRVRLESYRVRRPAGPVFLDEVGLDAPCAGKITCHGEKSTHLYFNLRL